MTLQGSPAPHLSWESTPCHITAQDCHLVAARFNYNNNTFTSGSCGGLEFIFRALTAHGCGNLQLSCPSFPSCIISLCWKTGALSSREQRSLSLMFISQTATWEDGKASFTQLHRASLLTERPSQCCTANMVLLFVSRDSSKSEWLHTVLHIFCTLFCT